MAPRMQTKVRVKRIELLKIVDGRVRKAENDYKRAVEAHPGKISAWETACVAKIEKALTNAKAGRFPENEYGGPKIVLPARPEKPSEGRDLCNLRRMATTLKIGAEENVLLSQDDADFYFGPCVL